MKVNLASFIMSNAVSIIRTNEVVKHVQQLQQSLVANDGTNKEVRFSFIEQAKTGYHFYNLYLAPSIKSSSMVVLQFRAQHS